MEAFNTGSMGQQVFDAEVLIFPLNTRFSGIAHVHSSEASLKTSQYAGTAQHLTCPPDVSPGRVPIVFPLFSHLNR